MNWTGFISSCISLISLLYLLVNWAENATNRNSQLGR